MSDSERDGGARSSLAALALAALLLLAGCGGPLGGPDGAPTTNSSATPGSPSTAGADSPPDASGTETPASAAPRTGTGTAAPPPSTGGPSPWGEDPLVVAVEGERSDARDEAALVREATAYWERNAERYAGYPVSFRVRPNASTPDVVVRFVSDVPDCGGAEEAAGCAPYVTDPESVDRPVPVFVRAGLSGDSTVRVLKHEFGHVLGLDHGDAPRGLMRPRSTLYTTPQPNATDRAFPWNDSTFTVYLDDRGVERPETVRSQVDHALGYYEDGAPGMPNNLTFRYVDDPARADVVIRFRDRASCQDGSGSCAAARGPDPDGDGAIETYGRLTITLVDVDPEAVGWHVGNWLAYGLGAEAERERPPPFRDADYEERRGRWWTRP